MRTGVERSPHRPCKTSNALDPSPVGVDHQRSVFLIEGSRRKAIQEIKDDFAGAAEPDTLVRRHEGAVHENGVDQHRRQQLFIGHARLQKAEILRRRLGFPQRLPGGEARVRDQLFERFGCPADLQIFDDLWRIPRRLDRGEHVARGSAVRVVKNGSSVVYANTITKTEHNDETDEDEEHKIPFMKGYTVFNIEQIDNLPAQYYATAQAPQIDPAQRIAHAEQFLNNTGAVIVHRGNRAFYSPDKDLVTLPPFEFFKDPESYYGTRLHETTHWTRHPTRLDRNLGRKKWGDEGYAMEELVAELGSAFLCADLGLTPEVREDHAAYIANWLTVLKGDKRAIFSAAAHAQRAAEFLHKLQPEPQPTPDPEPESKPAAPAPKEETRGQLELAL